MTSLSYDEIYSCFLRKITDYDFLHFSVDDSYALLNEYFHSATAKPYTRRLFSTFKMDDAVMELTYELKNVVNDDEDYDFVIETLALGILVEWLEPQLNSKLLTQQMITSSKESKYYSQAQHLSEMKSLYEVSVAKQRAIIRDRGYIYNSYLEDN